jgi:hypothetical protein
MDASLLADSEFWLEVAECLSDEHKQQECKTSAKVAMMAIKAFLGFDFLSGGWAASKI